MIGRLFEVQPHWCREKLPFKEIQAPEFVKKVLFFDPAPIYERCGHLINPFERNPKASAISVSIIFKNEPGVCACGCGAKLTGRKTRWATEGCAKFPVAVYFILQGRTANIYNYLATYNGDCCHECGDTKVSLFVDHKHPVKLGGAGGWLSNYQLLCSDCHRDKTNRDFGWKGSRANKVQQVTLL